MPYPLANLSKRTIRHDVASLLGDNWPLATSGAGNGGGTTAVFASLAGEPPSNVVNKYLLIEESTNDGEYRVTTTPFTASSGTITVRRAYTAQVATSIDSYLHEFSPHLYTLGINEAFRQCYRAVYREHLHHTFIREAGQKTVPLPRGMERVMRVMECRYSSEKLRDFFDRTASATDPGGKWTAATGTTWGVTSEGLYCVSDTNGDIILAATNPQMKNGVIECVIRGDTTDAAGRVLDALFRYEDTSNFLYVRLYNDTVDLRRRSGGSEASLTTATVTLTENVDYVLRIMFDGSWISIWIDDRQVVMYELTGRNLQYLGYDESGTGTYGNVGFRLVKDSTPSLAATATRVSHYFAHALVGRMERRDWKQAPSGRMIELQTMGRGWSTTQGRMLWLEGASELTAVGADTAFEILATDSTATVEIQTTDPAYEILLKYAAWAVLRDAAMPGHTSNPEKRKEYAERALMLRADYVETRKRKAMRWFQGANG